ncbi:MAG: ATP synthase F0 subunit B [Saccharofermentanales bacterium]
MTIVSLAAVEMFSPEALAAILVTMIAVIINVGIMYLVVKRFLYKPLRKMINERQAKTIEAMKVAEAAKAQADAQMVDLDAQRQKAEAGAAQLLIDARKQAAGERDALLNDARQRSAELLDATEEDTMRLRQDVLNRLKSDIAQLVIQTTGDVVKTIDQEQLVVTALEKHMSSEPVNGRDANK